MGGSSALAAQSAATPAGPAATVAAGIEEHAGKAIVREVPAPAGTAPANSKTGTGTLEFGRVAMALTGVIGLILILRWFARSMLPASMVGQRSGAVKVLTRCPLGPRQQVVLLQIGRRIIVASDCSSQLATLCQITDADEVAALLGSLQQEKTVPASVFTSWLSQARQAFGADEQEDARAEPAAQHADVEIPGPDGHRAELHGLTEKVRQLARQFGGGRPAA